MRLVETKDPVEVEEDVEEGLPPEVAFDTGPVVGVSIVRGTEYSTLGYAREVLDGDVLEKGVEL